MNVEKLREAAGLFLSQYPDGFESQELTQVTKRHNVGKMVDFAQSALAKQRFNNTASALDDIIKTVSRSSMVSMFEKPKFRDYVNGANRDDRERLAAGFKKLLHGNQEKGFNEVLDLLIDVKLAKWSLMTICLLYVRPDTEVFVKPTTTKNVIRQFELDALEYKPRPSWEFYAAYREAIAGMKKEVAPSLSPNNAAFTGFLMMTTAVGK